MSSKIVICDDEPHIRLLIQQCLEELEDEGVTLLLAVDGEQGLQTIRAEIPQLIILDVMMPRMNGFEVCEQVKADASLASAYVILLTAKGQENDRRRGEGVHADRYMTKPFDPDELLEIARQVLGLAAP